MGSWWRRVTGSRGAAEEVLLLSAQHAKRQLRLPHSNPGMSGRAPSYTSCMVEPHIEPQVEQKPGTGIDRTTIQRLLALTPAERIKLAVLEANKFAELIEKMRIR